MKTKAIRKMRKPINAMFPWLGAAGTRWLGQGLKWPGGRGCPPTTWPNRKKKRHMDANHFTRMLNALVKLAGGEIKCEKHKLETAQREAEQRNDPSRKKIGLSPEVRKEIEENRFNPPER